MGLLRSWGRLSGYKVTIIFRDSEMMKNIFNRCQYVVWQFAFYSLPLP